VSGSVGSVGSTITYKLYPSSDKDTEFSRDLRTLTNTAAWSVSKEQITKMAPQVTTSLQVKAAEQSGFTNTTTRRHMTCAAG
jgi:hypothetical protein